jgi:hypothetical protein
MLNHPCILGMKPTWSWWMIFLMCCWVWFAIILLRILHWCSLRRLAYSSPFWKCLCHVLGWHNLYYDTSFIIQVRQCSFPLYLVEQFKEGWY